MNLIAFVPALTHPFFTTFFEHFENAAQKTDSLLVLKHDPTGERLKSGEILYGLITKGIRNIVILPPSAYIDQILLRRLRGAGTNLVFFDHPINTPYADSVTLDAEAAISDLYEELLRQGARKIDYISLSEQPALPNTRLRDMAFEKVGKGKGRIFRIAEYGKPGHIEKEIEETLVRLKAEKSLPDAFICCNGTLGTAMAIAVERMGLTQVKVATIDFWKGMENLNIIAYEQPLKELAYKTYDLLLTQNRKGAQWKADRYFLRGRIVRPRR